MAEDPRKKEPEIPTLYSEPRTAFFAARYAVRCTAVRAVARSQLSQRMTSFISMHAQFEESYGGRGDALIWFS